MVRDVTIITVHYNTPVLLASLLASVRRWYPDVPITVIDGSDQAPYRWAAIVLGRRYGASVDTIGSNIHHGPGLDRGIRAAKTPLVLVMDSDVRFTRAGVIERAVEALRPDDFGVGGIQWVDDTGWDVPAGQGTPYLHPRLALIRRAAYLEGPPAIKHGAPFLPVMEHLSTSQAWAIRQLDGLNDYFVEHRYGTVERTGSGQLEGDGMGRPMKRIRRAARRLLRK